MRSNERGFILASLIITTTFIFIISAFIIQLIINNFTLAKQEQFRINAQLGADSGVDLAITELNHDEDWSGTSGEIDIFNDTDDLRVTTEVVISTVGEDKTVEAVGRAYSPSTDTSPRSTRKLKVDLYILGGGEFSVVTGVGGLVMNNSAKIVGGDVHVNGDITMTNSSQIGLTSNPVNLDVAHYSCPITGGPTYPIKCTSGESINISNTAHIYGDVCANNQTDGSDMSDSGLLEMGVHPECLVEVTTLPFPDHDRMQQITNWQNEGSTTMTGAAASCTTNGGSRTWTDNLKITGDVLISKKCTVTMQGDVWIAGDLDMINSSELMVADVLGTPLMSPDGIPSIMVDGMTGANFNNSSSIISNSSDVGPIIITYYSTDSCTTIDDPLDTNYCPNLTGTELFNSRNITTLSLDQSSNGSQTIFFAKWTRVTIHNSGDIGAIVGQTVELRNSGAISFGAAVPGGGPPTFLVDDYRRDF